MKRVIVALALAAFVSAGAASADSITVTNGTVELDVQSGTTTAVLLGTNSDITGFGTNSNPITFNAGAVNSITPNVNISTGGSEPASPQLINGVMFPGNDRLQGSLFLTTAPFNAAVLPGSVGFFRAPFSLTGTASIFDPAGTLVGTTSLAGGGQASILANTASGAVTSYAVQHISYEFAAGAPQTTPEPDSILLLGVALGGGTLRRWLLRQ